MLREFSGASVRRVVDRSSALVPEHAHDWPVLSLFVIGGYSNRTEIGETFIAAPSAILYRAGAAHQNTVASTGFEQIEIEFDPRWLGCEGFQAFLSRDGWADAPARRRAPWRAFAHKKPMRGVCARPCSSSWSKQVANPNAPLQVGLAQSLDASVKTRV